MAFDIHALDEMDYEGEEQLESYQEALVELFIEAPEGQAIAEESGNIGFWTSQLLYYGFCYEGVALPKMSLNDIETIVTEVFPRKISLRTAEEAKGAIGELTAFWRFLKREYGLKQADRITRYLEGIESQFPAMMMDTSRFGMAKSFFMMGNESGFDMSSEEGMNAFMASYNANLIKPQVLPEINIVDLPRSANHKAREARKHKRKMARASRSRNRKRK